MSRQLPRQLAAFCLPLLLVPSALGGIPGVPTRPFPMTVVADHGKFGVEVVPNGAALADLATLTRVTLTGVPLQNGARVDVDLQRVIITDGLERVDVDGVTQAPGAQPLVTLWDGHVANDPLSSVFIGFSASGTRGFIRTSTELFQVLAAPGPNNDWNATTTTIVSNEQVIPPTSATAPDWCTAIKLPGHTITTPTPAPAAPATTSIPSTGVVPIYELKVAVETDTQYYSIFNDLAAAQSYLTQLLGAVSWRYRVQAGVIITYPYVGYHTATDNWASQENGSGAGGLLGEFQAAWSNGGAPVSAHDYCFISGAGLGGGVAWLPGVCNAPYNFAVCGNIGGNTPFPISVGPLNWDFVVTAHELGHNMGAPHTHDYCPPADRCAPSGYFGQCQTQQVCTNQGTIMSYCHLCSGGFWNETTYFHANSLTDMRNLATSGCLPLFKGLASNVNLGFALAGANGFPILNASYDKPTNFFRLTVLSALPGSSGVLFFAANRLDVPLYGGTLVPNTTLLIPINISGLGGALVSASVPPSAHIPGGATFYAQAWINDPGPPNGAFAATNAVEFEMIVP